jgi:succinate dehydrogenase flavin-adding protein (antitoxin of CptAB toxin-antitoxin module)
MADAELSDLETLLSCADAEIVGWIDDPPTAPWWITNNSALGRLIPYARYLRGTGGEYK